MQKPLSLFLFLALTGTSLLLARPLQIDDLFAMKRMADPALSPDGRWIVFTLTTADLAANKNFSDLWIIGSDGQGLRRLTDEPAADRRAAWSPDGKWILFESARSGRIQIWRMTPDGSQPEQLTTIATGASQPVVSPDGKWLAFLSEVFPEYSGLPFSQSDSLNSIRLGELEHGLVKAKIFTKLLYRHWDSWVDGKRIHLFVQPFPSGEPRDLTPGDRDAVPTSSTFSAGTDFAFSPDSRMLAYTATPTPPHEEAWRTNHDIYEVPVTGGTPRQITTNPAADGYPRYSPDGQYIAYRAQRRPDYEGDRWELMVYRCSDGSIRTLTSDLDASVGAPLWSPDSKTLYFDADVRANSPLYAVTVKGNDLRIIVSGKSNHNVSISADGKKLFFLQASAVRPAELYCVTTTGSRLTRVSGVNDDVFAHLTIPAPEEFWFTGAAGARVHSWLYLPPDFDATRKYPLVMLVHGGPQGSWGNSWSYRWNPPLWAAQGYVVIAPNPRGSTGFGQRFTDEINGAWGGKVYDDLMCALDTVSKFPFVDSTRRAAAGASFGGYMMNWFLGHTGTRFKAIVTHDGVYNFESMYGATDEIWFDEWEHGGTPWNKPEEYARYSPHRFARNFRTPTLVIHGGRDFRIPETEAMQLFTALQRQGVPSKFLYFPDENHWVLRPADSKLWHETVFGWLDEWVRR
jgi:dipeptidyl aminopeptidase/acylaminoacyl peptidase